MSLWDASVLKGSKGDSKRLHVRGYEVTPADPSPERATRPGSKKLESVLAGGDRHMFVIEATKDGRHHRVLDRDANVYLKWLVAGGPYFTEVFSLVHAAGSVPFTTAREEGIDPESALPFFVYKFLSFGSAPKAHRNTRHLVNRTFEDEAEQRRWMEVAAEALLVFGWAYNGLKAPHPSYTRVDLGGRIYTLKDFGYALNSK